MRDDGELGRDSVSAIGRGSASWEELDAVAGIFFVGVFQFSMSISRSGSPTLRDAAKTGKLAV